MNSYELVIREHHLDTFGHVNNATYLALFEEARWELITARGSSLQKIVAVKQGPIILEVNLKFLSELELSRFCGVLPVTLPPLLSSSIRNQSGCDSQSKNAV